MQPNEKRPLQRSRSEHMVAGVCGGLAAYFDVDPVIVRLAFVLLTTAGGAGLLSYIALWIIMPLEGTTAVRGAAGVGQGIKTMATEAGAFGRGIHEAMSGSETTTSGTTADPALTQTRHGHRGVLFGLILVIVGVWLLLGNLGLMDWATGRYVWPAILILGGLGLMAARLRN